MTRTAYKFKTVEDLKLVQGLHPDGNFLFDDVDKFLSEAVEDYGEDDLVVYYNPNSNFTYSSGKIYHMNCPGQEPIDLTHELPPLNEEETSMQVINRHFDMLGISVQNMAVIVYEDQLPYIPNLTMFEAELAVMRVLTKDEFQHSLLTAIELDKMAQKVYENNEPLTPLAKMLIDDEPNFGVDENVALAVSGLYGSIATSNFGHLDKTKPGIVGILNEKGKNHEYVTTMLDDMISAIISSAEAKIAKGK